MAFQFATGQWSIPAINEPGDFSYTAVLTYDDTAGATAVGELGTGNSSITFLSGGLVRIRVGSASVNSFSGFEQGDVLTINVARVAGTVTASINGGTPQSVNTTATLNINTFGRGYDAASQYTGIIYSFVFNGDNALERDYDFDAAPGTQVLSDSVSNQNGSPVGFTTDDFIVSDSDAPVITGGAISVYAQTSVTYSAASDEACNVSAVPLALGDAQPNGSVFDASTDTASATAGSPFNIEVTGLTEATFYTVWLRFTDSFGNSSYVSEDVYTPRTGYAAVRLVSPISDALASVPSLDAGDLIEYQAFDGAVVIDQNGDPNVADGTTEFLARAIDVAAGDIGAEVTITIGDAAEDATPSAFSFTAENSAPVGDDVLSNSIEVQGVTAGVDVPISITGAGAGYVVSTDAGQTWGAATSSATTVQLGYLVRIIISTPVTYSTAASATLTIGGVSAAFNITTVAASAGSITDTFYTDTSDTTPYTTAGVKYWLIDASDEVVLAGTVNPNSSGEVTIADAALVAGTYRAFFESADGNTIAAKKYTVS